MSDISETLVEHVYISVGYHSLGDNLRGAKTSLSTSKVSVLYKRKILHAFTLCKPGTCERVYATRLG